MIRKVAGLVFLSVWVLLLLGSAQAEERESLSLPQPPESNLMDTHNMRMGGTDVSSYLYLSSKTEEAIIKYYQNFFTQNQFETVFDKTLGPRRLLRVKKGDRIANVVVMPKDEQTEVVIAHYRLPPGLSPFEEPKPTWGEIVSALPEDDLPGEDLSFIPRPEDSVRLASVTHENSTYITYTTAASPPELRDFYKSKMQLYGWHLEQEIDTQEATQRFKQFTAGKNVKVGLPAGVSLEELTDGGYILNFQGSLGKAQVSLISNNLSKDKRGSFVQVRYVKE